MTKSRLIGLARHVADATWGPVFGCDTIAPRSLLMDPIEFAPRPISRGLCESPRLIRASPKPAWRFKKSTMPGPLGRHDTSCASASEDSLIHSIHTNGKSLALQKSYHHMTQFPTNARVLHADFCKEPACLNV